MDNNNKSIGVLALQGAFAEHIDMLNNLGATCYEIRNLDDLACRDYDGLVLPGGESTAQSNLLIKLGMYDRLRELIASGTPTLATCAGSILLSKSIANSSVPHLGTLPVSIKRNAYGRQLGSFYGIYDMGEIKNFPMIFIRAPYFEKILDDKVKVLATVDDKIVAVRYNNQLALSFHPEVSTDSRIHKYFLELTYDISR
ncbi:MAG: pyridoxal 5'-phosphate synthase glutaminase subunit PdxT [Pseudobutyrivibrio sp.]|nr:pyridoxal 5'-phosphate synthase glutaminase subunit PdxT [Pseudobutyrivibrio sp.]